MHSPQLAVKHHTAAHSIPSLPQTIVRGENRTSKSKKDTSKDSFVGEELRKKGNDTKTIIDHIPQIDQSKGSPMISCCLSAPLIFYCWAWSHMIWNILLVSLAPFNFFSLPCILSMPSLLTKGKEKGAEDALMLCKHGSEAATTLLCYQLWFSHKSKL